MNSLPPQLPFWRECLRLLYWIYFKPFTLAGYLNALEPDLPRHYSLWEARRRLRHNPRLQRLLWQALFLKLLLPWPAAALAGWLSGSSASEVYWFVVAVGVGSGIAFGVAFGVVFSVAYGIGSGIGFVVAFGVAVSVTRGLVDGVVDSVTFGVVVGVVVGVTFGVSSSVMVGVMVGVAGAIAVGVAFGVAFGVAIGILFNVVAGVAFGVAAGVAFIVSYLRLYQYPLEWFCLRFLLSIARLWPDRAWACARLAPYHWDEVIRFPLWGAEDLVRRVARVNLGAGLDEIQQLFDSVGQQRLGQLALANVTADVIQDYAALPQLAAAPEQINWLPKDLKSIRPDVAEVVPGLFSISKDLAQTAQADNPLSRRLGLRDALNSLEALHKRLPFLGREARERWVPVLNRWNSVIVKELEALQAGGVSSGVENPYEVGNPVQLARRTLFKGRADLRDAIVNALRERGKVTLVLSGPRRMGKTSLLLQLPALLPGKTIPVFVDLQRPAATASDGAFLYEVSRAISRDAQPYRIILPPPAREAFSASPFEAFDGWLNELAIPNLQDFTLLLTFDEFEKAGEALRAGRLSSQVLDELRHTSQHREPLALLFAGVQTLDELGPEWSSYFINVRALTIGYLSPAEAEELICNPDPQVEFTLTYADDAVAHILTQTCGHPYLVQLVCSCVVEVANKHRTQHADLALTDAAEALALERGEPYFRNVWDEMAGPDSQPLLRQIAAASGPLPFPDSDPATLKALDRMTRRRVIAKNAAGYTVALPLVRRWVNERAPA